MVIDTWGGHPLTDLCARFCILQFFTLHFWHFSELTLLPKGQGRKNRTDRFHSPDGLLIVSQADWECLASCAGSITSGWQRKTHGYCQSTLGPFLGVVWLGGSGKSGRAIDFDFLFVAYAGSFLWKSKRQGAGTCSQFNLHSNYVYALHPMNVWDVSCVRLFVRYRGRWLWRVIDFTFREFPIVDRVDPTATCHSEE